MSALQTLLDRYPFILADGAMGTMLMDAGLANGEAPERWNVDYPDRVAAVHQAYIDAGSRIVLTNTFGGTRFRLDLHKLGERAAEFNEAGAALARRVADAAPETAVVAGSMGPSGEMLIPLGVRSFEELKDAFAEQAAALERGGADVLWIETMSALDEVRAAVEAAREVTSLPVVTTMTFDTHGRTMMGVTPQKALETLREWGPAAIGGNCGNGPGEIEDVIVAMRAADPDVVLVAKSNAGLPKMVKGEIVYDGTPEVMADYAVRVFNRGARIIGGCCGSTPDHLRAMADALARAASPV